MHRLVSHKQPSLYKFLYSFFLILILCSISSVVTAKNINDTPRGKGHQLSTECSKYIEQLNAEELDLLSTQMYWQYVGRMKPEKIDEINALTLHLVDKSAAKIKGVN